MTISHVWRWSTLEAMLRRLVLAFWPVIDKVLRVIQRIKPLRPDDSGIIRFSLRRYRGPTRILDDGCSVGGGDTVIELHLNNDWFRRRRELKLKASQSPREFLGCFAEDLRFLARQVASGKYGDRVAALHGITLLDVAARRLGFQVDELPDSLWKRGARFYMGRLMRVYHLRGDEGLGLKERDWQVKEVWLSRVALLAKYGPGKC